MSTPQGPRGGPLYKLLPRTDWSGHPDVVPWAPIDRSDGFVHLSAAHQVRETAAKHFADCPDLYLLEVDPLRLSPGSLRWEVSRGGDHFPHVYADIEAHAVVGEDAVPRGEDGDRLPAHVPSPVPADAMPGDLAHRLECAESATLLALGRSALRTIPSATPAVVAHGAAVAARFGERSPINAVKGWGLTSPPSAEQLDALTALFGEVDAQFAVEIASIADPATLEILATRGYRAVATENVLVRSLAGPVEAVDNDDVSLEPVSSADASAWGELLIGGFAADDAPAEIVDFAARIGPLTHGLGQTQAFFIVADGARVGACALRFDHEVAMFNGSAIAPEHRRRGYHRAAIRQRLALARRAGCTLAKFDVAPGSASHRNAHRQGFLLSHTRTSFKPADRG